MISSDSITDDTVTAPAASGGLVTRVGSTTTEAARERSRLRKFLSYYQPYRGLFAADMACALVVSATTLLLPLCASYVTKVIIGTGAPHALNQIALLGALMLGLVGLQTLCTLFVDYQGHMMGAKMESDMRRELFEHYQKLSFSFYDEQRTGQLMTRISDDTFALAELYHHGPEDIVVTTLTVTGALIILLRINVALTLIVFLFLPLMAVFALYFNKRMNRALRASKDRIGDINAQVEDTLAGIRVVQSFTNEAVETRKFTYANTRFLASRGDGYRSESYYSGGLDAFGQLITITVITLGGIAILRASLDLADLVTYLLCVSILVDPIHKLINFGRLCQEGMTGFHRFMEALEVAPDIVDAPDAAELAGVRGRIELQHVSFKYRADLGEVVRDLSLEIHAGEYVALVGSSGAGKTTLCSLIPRFYDVTAGAILLDGHDVRGLTLRSLRGAIGVVQQDVYLFAGTVADNIRYGRLDASRDEIIAAAKRAHAHEFIMALPNGYDTDIGQRGVKLSGGQKQRLSIARVFLKDPAVIIFDEATSALDNESEKAIQDSLEALAHHRTMLVIAHRLSTIRNAQRIVVLANGAIAEQGSHAELLALNGVYANLYNTQSRL
ncbi:MAG TPA: ABC transporter ATP-binding protein [Ktedonobacterales bacterium]|nr:ABC transporter ATP-binding protein [Ktedonobacterales bacterium]